MVTEKVESMDAKPLNEQLRGTTKRLVPVQTACGFARPLNEDTASTKGHAMTDSVGTPRTIRAEAALPDVIRTGELRTHTSTPVVMARATTNSPDVWPFGRNQKRRCLN